MKDKQLDSQPSELEAVPVLMKTLSEKYHFASPTAFVNFLANKYQITSINGLTAFSHNLQEIISLFAKNSDFFAAPLLSKAKFEQFHSYHLPNDNLTIGECFAPLNKEFNAVLLEQSKRGIPEFMVNIGYEKAITGLGEVNKGIVAGDRETLEIYLMKNWVVTKFMYSRYAAIHKYAMVWQKYNSLFFANGKEKKEGNENADTPNMPGNNPAQ